MKWTPEIIWRPNRKDDKEFWCKKGEIREAVFRRIAKNKLSKVFEMVEFHPDKRVDKRSSYDLVIRSPEKAREQAHPYPVDLKVETIPFFALSFFTQETARMLELPESRRAKGQWDTAFPEACPTGAPANAYKTALAINFVDARRRDKLFLLWRHWLFQFWDPKWRHKRDVVPQHGALFIIDSARLHRMISKSAYLHAYNERRDNLEFIQNLDWADGAGSNKAASVYLMCDEIESEYYKFLGRLDIPTSQEAIDEAIEDLHKEGIWSQRV